ncbi:MAG TPA: Fur family transcriptional regulator [Candidatus Limnocylindrales bacterium]|nr:Fur family transcriptional regulator [Candidatus Limnocylindrales bacterium]
MTSSGSHRQTLAGAVPEIKAELRLRGQRWTPQRRLILEVLEQTSGHVTGSELVELCREREPDVTPSTVYRTLDVLEQLGYVSHSHSARGREEYHVLSKAEHAHLECRNCGRMLELSRAEADEITQVVEQRHGFVADLGHMTIVGLCSECAS